MAAESDEDLKRVYKQGYEDGVKTVAQQEAAGQLAKRLAVMLQAGKVATDVLTVADQLAADGDPDKQLIVDILKKSVTKSFKAMDEVTTGGVTDAERRAALDEAVPFSTGSPPSGTPSLSGREPSSGKVLSHEPPKPKRGRPPGSKSKPKSAE